MSEGVGMEQTRREREFQAQIKAHGGTGLPPDLSPLNARELGICLKCSGHWDAMHKHVWGHYVRELEARRVPRKGWIREGVALYCAEFGLDAEAGITSDAFRESLSKAQTARMTCAEGERIKSRIAERLSRPRPDLYGKTGPGPQSGSRSPAISTWPIVRLITSGMGQVETAKELNAANHRTIGRRAQSAGLSFRAAFLSDFGQPFTNGALFDLRRASGFETAEFESMTRLSDGRADGSRPSSSIANPEDARRVIEWRDKVIRELLKIADSGERALHLGARVYRRDEVLKTFLPGLPELNQALVSTIGEIRRAARQNPEWGVDGLCDFVCKQSCIEESAGGKDKRWRTTTQFLWQAESWIRGNPDRLRGTADDGPLVREMIGARYDASQWTVQNALRDRTEKIEPHEMQALLFRFAAIHCKPKRTPGPVPKLDHAKDAFKISAKVNIEIPRFEELFARPGKLPGKKQLRSAGYNDGQISALLEPTPATDAQHAARRLVAATEEINYDTVAKYHREFPGAGLN